MRNRTRSVLAAMLAALLCMGAPARAAPTSNQQTLQQFMDSVFDKAAAIELDASASQKAGHQGVAQNQFLLHDIVARGGEEIRYLKQAGLEFPVNALEASAIKGIDDFGDFTLSLVDTDAKQLPEVIARAQALTSAMLESFPEYTKYPVLYGMLVKDVSEDARPMGADIKVFGHRIVDPQVGDPPKINLIVDPKHGIGLLPFPDSAIRVVDNNENFEADIPDTIRDMVHFAPSTCQARNAFKLRLTAFYGEVHGIWPVKFVTTVDSNSDFTALATARAFELNVSYEYESGEDIVSSEKFSNRSDFVLAECGKTAQAAVKFVAPAGAHGLTCEVSWADQSGARASSKSCVVKDNAVEAVGTLTGTDKVCSPDGICGCDLNARGWLQIDGAYKRDNLIMETKKAEIPGKIVALANDATPIPISLPTGAKLRHVGILINRKACPAVYDRLDVHLNTEGTEVVSGTSKGGSFHADMDKGKITVLNTTVEDEAGGGSD